MPKKKIPKKVMNALKTVKDPDTGESLLKMGMLQNIVVTGKKVSLKIVPPTYGCAFCGVMNVMVDDIKKVLKRIGYKAEVKVGF